MHSKAFRNKACTLCRTSNREKPETRQSTLELLFPALGKGMCVAACRLGIRSACSLVFEHEVIINFEVQLRSHLREVGRQGTIPAINETPPLTGLVRYGTKNGSIVVRYRTKVGCVGSVRLRGCVTPVPLPRLPIEQVLFVTHLCWLCRDRRYDVGLKQASLPYPEPLVSVLSYATQVIQIRSHYLHLGDCRPFKVIQGNTCLLYTSPSPRD